MAKPKRYTEEQIIGVLKEIEAGASIASVGRAHGIGVQTLYVWRERYVASHFVDGADLGWHAQARLRSWGLSMEGLSNEG